MVAVGYLGAFTFRYLELSDLPRFQLALQLRIGAAVLACCVMGYLRQYLKALETPTGQCKDSAQATIQTDESSTEKAQTRCIKMGGPIGAAGLELNESFLAVTSCTDTTAHSIKGLPTLWSSVGWLPCYSLFQVGSRVGQLIAIRSNCEHC
ncbi:hypothetical protein [Ralstonia soli]|uniref:Uncharacterized protein n=1 Tax=Ralstonia soli TaxID=2953896 RepID=A0ABT1ASZ3_9RALS|nr:hypothetical protein [Ralstonia soli]MCO5401600.1 hypothetical protein [Ralstonia soli]